MHTSGAHTSETPFELESLAQAVHYQRWVSDAIQPYMGNRILEVGAGIGNMSRWLPVRELLVLTDTEPALLDILRARAPEYFGDAVSRVRIAPLDLDHDARDRVVSDVLRDHRPDTIVSFNVLEHVEDDYAAIALLLDVLRESPAPERRLVTFVPAQAWALSDLDRYYGHFRRYSKRRILDISRELAPEAQVSVTAFNALGLLGWVWSTMILKRTKIDQRSVKAYNAICAYTRHADDFVCRSLGYPLGQSFVWVLTLTR